MRINVIGSGHMGKQICSLFDVLGYDVLIWQNTKENLEKPLNDQIKRIEKNLNDLKNLSRDEIINQRKNKFRALLS